MTILEDVSKFDAYFSELKHRRLQMKKHPENYNEEEIDDVRVEWAWTKPEKRLNDYYHDVLEMMSEIINSFLVDDEVIPVYDLAKRLDIGPNMAYDIENGMLVCALRELEAMEKIHIHREPGVSVSFQAIYRQEPEPHTPATVDAHGISKCICNGCLVKLKVLG